MLEVPSYMLIAQRVQEKTNYDESLAKFDMMWGGNDIIHHWFNDEIVWHIRASNVGLVNCA